MLILKRRFRQTLHFETSDGPINVTVLSDGKKQVVLGIDAPPSVVVVRAEAIRNQESELESKPESESANVA